MHVYPVELRCIKLLRYDIRLYLCLNQLAQ